jgi:hypothetical protein
MDTLEQETQQTPEVSEETCGQSLEQDREVQRIKDAQDETFEETAHDKPEKNEQQHGPKSPRDRSGFVHGLAAGLGIGCITAFILMWTAVYFTPQLPLGITYADMLAMFIYPLIYLLALGLIALTAGIVREYYIARTQV